ncbi:MAG TPA: DUF2786 domain-containing protein [Dermatophilaceae bacterium]|nr:DUF2786 domain-containing protein [Dermatophilaceae bacterium]
MGRNNRQRRAAKARERAARRASSGSFGTFGGAPQAASWGPSGAWDERAPRPPTLEEQVAAEVLDAADRLRSPGRYAADRAVARVVHAARTPAGRRAVTARLVALLTDCVAMAWERGWQPADLHRIVGRHHDDVAQLVVGDAMAHQLGRFAEGTVAQRWPAQLREVGATRWWARDADPVTARVTQGDLGLERVVPAALEVISLLADLPTLERLDPLPGRARAEAQGAPGARGGAGPVDERILSRVRALLAKAESTPYEAEADTFTAGAQALMARHSIDAAMLAAGARRPSDRPGARRIGIDRPYEAPKVLLLDVVATANRCRTVWSKGLGFVTVVGFEPDIAAAETIFTSLLVQATRAVAGEGRRVTRHGQSRTRAFRQSFLTAYAHRIGDRLREVTEHETEAAAERTAPAQAEAGTARANGVLVRVLAERATEVDARVAQLFPRLVDKPLGSMTPDMEGWSAGTIAADRATLFGSGHTIDDSAAG